MLIVCDEDFKDTFEDDEYANDDEDGILETVDSFSISSHKILPSDRDLLSSRNHHLDELRHQLIQMGFMLLSEDYCNGGNTKSLITDSSYCIL